MHEMLFIEYVMTLGRADPSVVYRVGSGSGHASGRFPIAWSPQSPLKWGAMPEIEADPLWEAVQNMHGGTAMFAQTVPARETFEGETVWNGVVHIFDLAGHPTAIRAYAGSSPIEGSTKRRFFVVLHTERISSPIEAVRSNSCRTKDKGRI
jgi:hypothetical protein